MTRDEPATGYVAPPEPGHPPIWQPDYGTHPGQHPGQHAGYGVSGRPLSDGNQHLDGVPWWEAPAPPRRHKHWAQTTGWLHEGLERVERCACGAIQSDLKPGWVLLDAPRVADGGSASGQPYSGATPTPGGSDSGGGKRRSWFSRHKALTFVLAAVALCGVFLIAAMVSVATSTPGGPLNAPVATGAVQPVPPAPKPSTAEASTAPTADPTDPPPSDGTVKVGQSVTYEDGTVVTVASVKRVAFSDVSYGVRGTGVSVVVKITNGGSSVLDLALAQVALTYGADGQESDQVFDSAKGFEGGLETKLAPGRSATAKYGFAVPAGTAPVSVQVTPDFSSETAIFEGRTS
jgi:cytoskeletal protein RodZ